MRAPERRGHGDQLLADALGDVVTLELALGLADEVHLDVGDIGAAPQEVVPHQAVEVVGRGNAGVGLEVHNLGLLLDDGGQFAGDARGFFERGSLGHVDDDLELALVVERQHLHLDEADADEDDRAEEHRRDQRQKSAARSGVMEQRIHHAAVEAGEAVLALRWRRGRRRRRGSGRRPTVSPPGRRSARRPWRPMPPIGIGRM